MEVRRLKAIRDLAVQALDQPVAGAIETLSNCLVDLCDALIAAEARQHEPVLNVEQIPHARSVCEAQASPAEVLPAASLPARDGDSSRSTSTITAATNDDRSAHAGPTTRERRMRAKLHMLNSYMSICGWGSRIRLKSNISHVRCYFCDENLIFYRYCYSHHDNLYCCHRCALAKKPSEYYYSDTDDLDDNLEDRTSPQEDVDPNAFEPWEICAEDEVSYALHRMRRSWPAIKQTLNNLPLDAYLIIRIAYEAAAQTSSTVRHITWIQWCGFLAFGIDLSDSTHLASIAKTINRAI